MKHMLWLMAAGIFALFVSCDNLTDSEKTQKELLGRIWQLQSLETIDGDKIDVPEDQFYTLQIHEDGSFGGTSDCNAYGGKVNVDDGLFRVTELVHTEAYCGDESLDGTYMNALQSALAFEVRSGRLRIFYVDGFQTMVFLEQLSQ